MTALHNASRSAFQAFATNHCPRHTSYAGCLIDVLLHLSDTSFVPFAVVEALLHDSTNKPKFRVDHQANEQEAKG
jgi:hypothetical protein